MQVANEDVQFQCSQLHTVRFLIYEWFPVKFRIKSTMETLSMLLYFCTYIQEQTSIDFIQMKSTIHMIFKQKLKAVRSVVQMSGLEYSQEFYKV